MEKKSYKTLGLMSGTSLDGLDIALCQFDFDPDEQQWIYSILKCETTPYDVELKIQLKEAPALSGVELTKLDWSYGRFIGDAVQNFITKHHCDPDFISSHGHTIFHQPGNGFTLQIGHGACIASMCNLPVINDFRVADVSKGGQGAPLVPIGDHLLFPQFDACLNLGGFANISFAMGNRRIAYDISPCNLPLNRLAMILGKPHDEGGKIAARGTVNETLLEALNDLSFYKKQYPKSLGTEWLSQYFTPIWEASRCSVEDKLATITRHIAQQMASNVPEGSQKVLVTGGGAYNKTLLTEMSNANPSVDFFVPEKALVEFKEAMIFGFLGTLRWLDTPNTLHSVTGGAFDSCGGIIHLP